MKPRSPCLGGQLSGQQRMSLKHILLLSEPHPKDTMKPTKAYRVPAPCGALCWLLGLEDTNVALSPRRTGASLPRPPDQGPFQ